MKIIKSFVVLASLASVLGQSAPNIRPGIDLQKEMNQNLELVRSVFEAGYAPRAWKQQFAQWDLGTTVDSLKARVTAQTSVADYQQIVKQFFHSTKDYHVSVGFLSTEAATLPLVVRGVGGKYYLAHIDRTKLPNSSFDFNEGDEVVEFDGKTIAEAIQAVRAEGENNVDVTDQSLAELTLTRRRASRGYKVPQGTIVVGIKKQGATNVSRIQLMWDYTAERINRIDGSKYASSSLPSFNQIRVPSFFNRPMMANVAGLSAESAPGNVNKFAIGEKTSYLPELGKVIWKNPADKYFNAYIYQNADKRLIGVIRIPSYVPTVEPVAAVAEFGEILKHFKDNTEALVIDQLSNPGGSVFYLYALASMLTDQPLYTPKHRMTILPSDVAEAAEMITDLEKVKTDEDAKKAIKAGDLGGYPVDYTMTRFLLEFSKFYVNQWNEGKRLSDPFFVWGADKINPSNVVQYTKPILILTNELDFSGGDFFPTIMQDNRRAKIMGTRTAGAGGYVLEVKLPNLLGIESFRYTGSIAQRIDQNPIENLGVTPDVALAPTADDFTQGFVPFKNKVNEEVNKFFEQK